MEQRFRNFLDQYRKSYDNGNEYDMRFKIFERNVNFIDDHNSKNSLFTLGINKFTDLSKEEYRKMLGYKPINKKTNLKQITGNVAEKVDWRSRSKVNQIQDQGTWGSCWSFSTTSSIEGAYAIKYNQLLKLSEQQLVDCTKDYGNWGCDGGDMDWSFRYLQKNAFWLNKDYPYKGVDQACQTSWQGYVKVLNYTDVPNNSTLALKEAINIMPTTVSVDADSDYWIFYKSGIINTLDWGTYLDHAVTAVGYDQDNGQEYFIVRNSHGTDWGINGYVHIATGSDEFGGVCGILMGSSYAEVIKV